MSLETKIREAFVRHALDARPQADAWKQIQRRIAQRNRGLLAATTTAVVVLAVAAVIVPRALTRDDQLVRPRPLEMTGWKIHEDRADRYTFRHPATWTPQRAERSDLVVVLPNEVPKAGGKPIFSLDLALEPGPYGVPQPPPNAQTSAGLIDGRYSFVRIEVHSEPNVSVRWRLDWTAAGCSPGAGRCLAQTLVANLSASTPTVWERYGETAEHIVRTVTPISLDDSAGASSRVEPELRVIDTLRGTATELFSGEIAVDPERNLVLIGEQHDAGDLEFRVRVADAQTLQTVRYLGPGLLRGVDPGRGLVYVYAGAGSSSATIDVYEVESGRRIKSLPTDLDPPAPALDLARGLAYVTRGAAKQIDVYDVADGFRLVRTLPVQASVHSMAIDDEGQILYLSSEAPPRITLIDATGGQVIRTLAAIENPTRSPPRLTAGDGLMASAVGNYQGSELGLYTAHASLSWHVHVNRGLGGPVMDRDQELVLDVVHDLRDGHSTDPPSPAPDLVEIRDLATGELLATETLPDGPVALAIDPTRRRLYVACLSNAVVMLSY